MKTSRKYLRRVKRRSPNLDPQAPRKSPRHEKFAKQLKRIVVVVVPAVKVERADQAQGEVKVELVVAVAEAEGVKVELVVVEAEAEGVKVVQKDAFRFQTIMLPSCANSMTASASRTASKSKSFQVQTSMRRQLLKPRYSHGLSSQQLRQKFRSNSNSNTPSPSQSMESQA